MDTTRPTGDSPHDDGASGPLRPSAPGRRVVSDDDLFTAVSPSHVSQAIAQQVRSLIHEGRLGPGDRLPSQRELCQRFGVSRVTIKEAYRILEAVGLVTIKLGTQGGAFVASPSSEQVSANIADQVMLSSMSAEEVVEARQVLELGIIPFVCARATEDDLRDLNAMLAEHRERVAADEYSPEMSVQFHIRIAVCAHNEAIEMLARSLHLPMLWAIRAARTVASRKGRGRNTIGLHQELVNAVAARDVDRATSIMNGLLDRSQLRLRERRELLAQDAASYADDALPTIL